MREQLHGLIDVFITPLYFVRFVIELIIQLIIVYTRKLCAFPKTTGAQGYTTHSNYMIYDVAIREGAHTRSNLLLY